MSLPDAPGRAARLYQRMTAPHFDAVWLAAIFLSPVLFTWAILPTFHLDVAGSIANGQQFPLWGTEKHPPLASWLGWIVLMVPGHDGWTAVALQSALNLLGIWFLWRIGGRVLAPGQRRLLAVGLLTSLVMTEWSLPGYSLNEDMIQIPFWAATVLFMMRGSAASGPARGDWALAGLFLGLSILSKYYAAALIIGLIGTSLVLRDYRRQWRREGLWLAIVVTFLVISPHLVWLSQHYDLMLQYAAPRMHAAHVSLADRLDEVFNVVAGSLILLLPGAALAIPAAARRPLRGAGRAFGPEFSFLAITTAVMLAAGVAFVASGALFPIRYQAPVAGFVMILLAGAVPEAAALATARRVLAAARPFWGLLFVLGAGIYLVGPPHDVAQEPAPEAVARIMADWDAAYSCGPGYALSSGDARGGKVFVSYAGRRVYEVEFDARDQTLIYDPATLERLGAVLISRRGDEPLDEMRKHYPASTPVHEITLPMRRNLRGETKTYNYSFVPPASCARGGS